MPFNKKMYAYLLQMPDGCPWPFHCCIPSSGPPRPFFRFNVNRKTTTLFWASNLLKREIETVVQEHKSNTSHTLAHNLVITSWSTAISISLPWNHFRLGKYPVLENTDIQVLNIRVFGGGKI